MYAEKSFLGRVPFAPGANMGLALALDTSAKRHAISFVPTETMTVAKVAIALGSKVGSPTFAVRIETDASGRPSGTLAWTNATFTGQAMGSAGWTGEVSLVASGTVNGGTLYHVVTANDHGTPASNNFTVLDQAGQSPASLGLDRIAQWITAGYNGTVWANRNAPIFVLSDSAGTVKIGQPFDTAGLATLSSFGVGMKFVAPFSGALAGVEISHLPNTGIGTVSVKLYDAADTLLGTAPLTAGLIAVIGNVRHSVALLFDGGPVAITAGATYRAVLSDAGNVDRVDFVTAPSSPVDYRTLLPVAQDYQWTQGSPGSWTDTPGKLPCYWGLIASSISTGGNSAPGGGDLGLIIQARQMIPY
ncbi:hypothetical protein J8F10_13695 [Gemmata sp. G18]|uniref:Uncharacterized protein n=1 Tax=Gemmata palustris TaxID=2822762 RepID=A0ABS5BRI2_9BACT|nr:hypothetical protein [Gemmata palustris]MBP3956339.1 hypothetical protein [Gemmata palustris]